MRPDHLKADLSEIVCTINFIAFVITHCENRGIEINKTNIFRRICDEFLTVLCPCGFLLSLKQIFLDYS